MTVTSTEGNEKEIKENEKLAFFFSTVEVSLLAINSPFYCRYNIWPKSDTSTNFYNLAIVFAVFLRLICVNIQDLVHAQSRY
jgi:hypothetical protein